jgi:multidrug efflux pump subunit AcrB
VDRQIASMLSSRLYAVPGVLRARPHDLLHRELLLEVDRYMLGEVGLRQQDLQPALAIALGGATVAALDEGSVATPVVVRLPAASGQSHADRIAQLQALTVTPANGAPVRLDSLLTLSMELQPAAIVRHDRQRAVRVDIYYSDRQAGEAAFAEAAKTMELPSDLTLVWE